MAKRRQLGIYRPVGRALDKPKETFSHGPEVVDAEFVPEDPVQPLNKQEWRVFLFFSQAKFDAAVACLRFVALHNGLYYYEDRRDGSPYTVPEFDTVKQHLKDALRCEAENEGIYSQIQRLSWALGFMTFVSIVLADVFSHKTGIWAQPVLNQLFWGVFFLLLLLGPLGLGIARGEMRRDPQPLPKHRMFYSDAEIIEKQQRQEEEEQREDMKRMLWAAVFAGWAANEYRKHNNRQLAEEIAKAQDRHSNGGRNDLGFYK